MFDIKKLTRLPMAKHGSLLIGSLFGVLLLFVFWHGSVHLPYIGNNFSYSADIRSIENTYDQANARYFGGRLSHTTFTIEPTHTEAGVTYLTSKLDTAVINDTTASTIARQYAIDAKTGRHQDTNQTYLLAPRDLEKDESFQYRHVTYDAEATMRYKGEDRIFGLKTFRYEADYGEVGSIVKDTAIAGPTSNQGIEYTPQLTMWFEPTTGWLIKFEEDTASYLFDRTTGVRTSPSSHFSNVYTEESIKQNVKYARNLKSHLSFGAQIVPSIIVLVSVTLASVWLLRKSGMRMFSAQVSAGLVITTAGVTLIGWLLHIRPLITLFSEGQAINPVTSLCFIIVAICTILIYRKAFHRPIAIALGGIIITLSALAIMGILGFLPFNIDLLFFPHSVQAFVGDIPARMSLFEAMMFLVVGSILIKGTFTDEAHSVKVATFAAGLVAAFGTMGLLGKQLALEEVFPPTVAAPLSIASLLLMIVLGLALLQALLNHHNRSCNMRHVLREVVPPILLMIPIFLFSFFAHAQQNSVRDQLRQAFEGQTSSIQSAISNGMNGYVNTLRGAQALFNASTEVTRKDWHRYVTTLDIEKNYPAIQTMGYMKLTTKDDLASFTQKVRSEGYPTFNVYPASDSQLYAPVMYANSASGKDVPELGYDMLSNAQRSTAIMDAGATSKVALSDETFLLQQPGQQPRNGSILLLPVYSDELPLTAEARKQSLQGFVYLTFDRAILINAARQTAQKNIDVELYDGLRKETAARLYGADTSALYQPRLTKTNTVYLADHAWTLYYKASPTFRLPLSEERRASVLFATGCLGYLLTLLLFFMVRSRLAPRLETDKKIQPHTKTGAKGDWKL